MGGAYARLLSLYRLKLNLNFSSFDGNIAHSQFMTLSVQEKKEFHFDLPQTFHRYLTYPFASVSK